MTNSESRTATASHTPGPWSLDKRAASRIVDARDNTIAVVSHHTVESYGTFLCNRELIAAAPDLLAALREIQTTVENNKVLIPSAIADFCRMWIAKATGAAS